MHSTIIPQIFSHNQHGKCEKSTDSLCGEIEATLNTAKALLQWTPLTHFWQRGESVIRSQIQRLWLITLSFRTCYSLTRDLSLSLSPSLYSSSSVSHAEIYPTISETTREKGKIIACQLTRIHKRYAHKSCCLATYEQGHVFLRKASEIGRMVRWGGGLEC